MSCEERIPPEQEHAQTVSKGKIESPFTQAITWNGYMTASFEKMIKDISKRIEGVERSVDEVKALINAEKKGEGHD